MCDFETTLALLTVNTVVLRKSLAANTISLFNICKENFSETILRRVKCKCANQIYPNDCLTSQVCWFPVWTHHLHTECLHLQQSLYFKHKSKAKASELDIMFSFSKRRQRESETDGLVVHPGVLQSASTRFLEEVQQWGAASLASDGWPSAWRLCTSTPHDY